MNNSTQPNFWGGKNKKVTSQKGFWVFAVTLLFMLAYPVYVAATAISDGPTTFTGDIVKSNMTLNDTGIFYNNNRTFVRDADVVLCKGRNVIDDLFKEFTCDIVCKSTDTNCDAEFDEAFSAGDRKVFIRQGDYNGVSTTLFGNTTVFGDGGGKSTSALTRIWGDGTNPIFNLSVTSSSENANLTKSIKISDIVFFGNSSDKVLQFTNVDILRLRDITVVNGTNCIYLDYLGIEPPTSSSIPGGFWIQDSQILCSRSGVYLSKQTQGYISNNWFPSGSASSLGHIVVNGSNKIRIFGNEFDDTVSGGSGIFFDDTDVTTHDITALGNWYGITSGQSLNFTNFGNQGASQTIMIDGQATSSSVTTDLPASSVQNVCIEIRGINSYCNAGNYGFNQTNPTELVHVGGNVAIDGDLKIDSTSKIGLDGATNEFITSPSIGNIQISGRGKIVYDGDSNSNGGSTSTQHEWNTQGDTKMKMNTRGDLIMLRGNLTVRDVITFVNNELIDNLVNGWLKLTGNVNVVGDLNVSGGAVIGGQANISNINNFLYVDAGNGSDIQTKLDLSNGGTLYVPEGNFTITIPLNYSDTQKIIGAGEGKTFIRAGAGWVGDYLLGSGTPGTDTEHVLIEGITFDCNSRVDTGIWFNTTKVSNVKRVRVQECNISSFHMADDNFYSKLEDITSTLAVVNDILIDDNEVVVSNARLSAPIAINITSGNNVQIEYAHIDGSGTVGIWIDSGTDIDLFGNRYEGYTTCIETTSNSNNVRNVGGRFSSCTTNILDGGKSLLSITGRDFEVSGNTTFKDLSGGTILHVDSQRNRVGIGTTNPKFDLHVAGTTQMDGNLLPDGDAGINIGTSTRDVNILWVNILGSNGDANLMTLTANNILINGNLNLTGCLIYNSTGTQQTLGDCI